MPDGTAGHSTDDLTLSDPYSYQDCDNVLIGLAQTAPHDCGDPNCPGVINKRKLEILEATETLLTAQAELADQIIKKFGFQFPTSSNNVIEILKTFLAASAVTAKEETPCFT